MSALCCFHSMSSGCASIRQVFRASSMCETSGFVD
jgi:hypothetical protein